MSGHSLTQEKVSKSINEFSHSVTQVLSSDGLAGSEGFGVYVILLNKIVNWVSLQDLRQAFIYL